MPNFTQLSRARGCLLGQLAGDNLGALVEFSSAAEIATTYPDGGPFDLVDGGVWGILAGQPTDDFEMALGLARAIVAGGGWREDAELTPIWRGARPRPSTWVGPPVAGLVALAAGRRPSSDSQANGALMRAAPIGIAYAGQPEEAAAVARRDARLTHPL